MPDAFFTSIDGNVPTTIPVEASGPDVGLTKLWVNDNGASGGWRRAGILWLHDGTTWIAAKRPSPPPDTSVAAGCDLTRVDTGVLSLTANTDTHPWFGIELHFDYKQHPSGFPSSGWSTAGPFYIQTPGSACYTHEVTGLTCGERHVARIRFRFTDYLKLGSYTGQAQYGAEVVGGWVAITAINFFC